MDHDALKASEDNEYAVNGALMRCTEGSRLCVFYTTHASSVSQGKEHYGNADDREPSVNIIHFGYCRILQRNCTPAPAAWERVQNRVKIGGSASLLVGSRLPCTSGGTILFVTSGQMRYERKYSGVLEVSPAYRARFQQATDIERLQMDELREYMPIGKFLDDAVINIQDPERRGKVLGNALSGVAAFGMSTALGPIGNIVTSTTISGIEYARDRLLRDENIRRGLSLDEDTVRRISILREYYDRKKTQGQQPVRANVSDVLSLRSRRSILMDRIRQLNNEIPMMAHADERTTKIHQVYDLFNQAKSLRAKELSWPN